MASKKVTAEKVSQSFVKQYYGHLSNDPAKTLFRFYKEESAFTHGEGNKPEPSVSGIKNIKTKISSLKLQDVNVDLDIGSVDAQESKDGGVIVLVTGVITRKWERPRQFVQSFFLARQENNESVPSYFVLNDTFRFLDVPDIVLKHETSAHPEAVASPGIGLVVDHNLNDDNLNDVDAEEPETEAPAPVTAPHAPTHTQTQPATTAAPPAPQHAQPIAPVPEPETSEKRAEPSSFAPVSPGRAAPVASSEPPPPPAPKDTKPLTWAGIAKAGISTAPAPSQPAPPAKSAAKAASGASGGQGEGSPSKGNRGKGGNKEGEGSGNGRRPQREEARFLYVKNLEGTDIKEEELREFFGTFGAVANVEYKFGSQYAFIEYADHEGFSKALERHKEQALTLKTKQLYVDEKRNTPAARSRGEGRGEGRGDRGGRGPGRGGGDRRSAPNGAPGSSSDIRPPPRRGGRGGDRADSSGRERPDGDRRERSGDGSRRGGGGGGGRGSSGPRRDREGGPKGATASDEA